MESQTIIGFEEFRHICNVKNHRDNYTDFGGFRIERTGVFRLHLEDASFGKGDLAALSGDCDQPALAFPCTVAQLRAFVAEAGLLGCIDDDSLGEVLAARSTSTAPFNQGVTLKKIALIEKYKNIWDTIERDFLDAPENGLRYEAGAIEYGYWIEEAALSWARKRGKLTTEKQSAPAIPATCWTGLVHTS